MIMMTKTPKSTWILKTSIIKPKIMHESSLTIIKSFQSHQILLIDHFQAVQSPYPSLWLCFLPSSTVNSTNFLTNLSNNQLQLSPITSLTASPLTSTTFLSSFLPCITHDPKLQSSSFSLSIFVGGKSENFFAVDVGRPSSPLPHSFFSRPWCIICPLYKVISGIFLQYWVLINFISHFYFPVHTGPGSLRFIASSVCLNVSLVVVKLHNFSGPRRQNTQSLLHWRELARRGARDLRD